MDQNLHPYKIARDQDLRLTAIQLQTRLADQKTLSVGIAGSNSLTIFYPPGQKPTGLPKRVNGFPVIVAPWPEQALGYAPALR